MKIFTVNINITNKCNIMCDYCSAYIPYNENNEMIMSNVSIKTIVECINNYLTDFHIVVVLLGGEPLLYPNLDILIKSLYSIKNLIHIEICTNASLLLQNIISNNTRIVYTLSYHIDMLIQNKLNIYNNNFIKNVQFLNHKNIPYSIKIMDKKDNEILSKQENINYLLNIATQNSIKFVKIRPTNKYHKKEKTTTITNKKYNQLVYYCRTINITKVVQVNKVNHSDVCFSYICNMENLRQYISLYNIKEWKNLKKQFNNTKICNNPVCLCPACEIVNKAIEND